MDHKDIRQVVSTMLADQFGRYLYQITHKDGKIDTLIISNGQWLFDVTHLRPEYKSALHEELQKRSHNGGASAALPEHLMNFHTNAAGAYRDSKVRLLPGRGDELGLFLSPNDIVMLVNMDYIKLAHLFFVKHGRAAMYPLTFGRSQFGNVLVVYYHGKCSGAILGEDMHEPLKSVLVRSV